MCCFSGYRRNKYQNIAKCNNFVRKGLHFLTEQKGCWNFWQWLYSLLGPFHVSAVFIVVHYTIQCILFCTQWGWKVTFCSIGTWFSKPFSLLVKRNIDWFARKSDIILFLFAPSLPNARFVVVSLLQLLPTLLFWVLCVCFSVKRLKITCTSYSQTEDHIECEVLWMICDSDLVMICAEIVGIGTLYQWFSSCGCSGPTIALSH